MSKFKRLFAMGEEKVAVVNNMFATGSSAQSVARVIQGQWNEFKDVSEKTLTQQLLRYKAQHIVSDTVNKQLALPETSPEHGRVLVSMNVLKEMQELAMIQKGRVLEFIEQTKSVKMPMSQISSDIKQLHEQLKDIQKMQFDLGVDTYAGPLLQAGRQSNSRTTLPDGTVIENQTNEAVMGALEALEHFRNSRVIEGEVRVLPASTD
jgi:hypothetical protein